MGAHDSRLAVEKQSNSWEWWPAMSAIEDYVKARQAAERIQVRVSQFRRQISMFADALSLTPHKAAPKIPTHWMPREELVMLLDEAVNAWDHMSRSWEAVPEDQRKHVSPPLLSLG
jgi:hypothetical protein